MELLRETEKPRKKLKLLTREALVVFRISLSVVTFYTYKRILLSEVLSGYSVVSAEHRAVEPFPSKVPLRICASSLSLRLHNITTITSLIQAHTLE